MTAPIPEREREREREPPTMNLEDKSQRKLELEIRKRLPDADGDTTQGRAVRMDDLIELAALVGVDYQQLIIDNRGPVNSSQLRQAIADEVFGAGERDYLSGRHTMFTKADKIALIHELDAMAEADALAEVSG